MHVDERRLCGHIGLDKMQSKFEYAYIGCICANPADLRGHAGGQPSERLLEGALGGGVHLHTTNVPAEEAELT